METATCKKGDTYSSANAITNSRKYIVGYIGNSNGFGNTTIEPVIWTMNSDGTYADYEKLPYPEKDFTGVAPQYILPNCISEDGTVIGAQLVRQDNECLPMIYKKLKTAHGPMKCMTKAYAKRVQNFLSFRQKNLSYQVITII